MLTIWMMKHTGKLLRRAWLMRTIFGLIVVAIIFNKIRIKDHDSRKYLK